MGLVGVGLLFAGLNSPVMIRNRPSLHEAYWAPTATSRVLLNRFPGLYDLYPQIFIERHIYGRPSPRDPFALWTNGNDRKILLDAHRSSGIPDSLSHVQTLGIDVGEMLWQWNEIPQTVYDSRYNYLTPKRAQWRGWKDGENLRTWTFFTPGELASVLDLRDGWIRLPGGGFRVKEQFSFVISERSAIVALWVRSSADGKVVVSAGSEEREFTFVRSKWHLLWFDPGGIGADGVVECKIVANGSLLPSMEVMGLVLFPEAQPLSSQANHD
jgi:hypothetical protein